VVAVSGKAASERGLDKRVVWHYLHVGKSYYSKRVFSCVAAWAVSKEGLFIVYIGALTLKVIYTHAQLEASSS